MSEADDDVGEDLGFEVASGVGVKVVVDVFVGR
jgi:hypothetical protein